MTRFLMIPGLLSDEALFQPMIDAFKNQYAIQIADVSSPSTIDECARSISEQIDGNVILLGFSYGAWVALHLYPQIKHLCQGIVMISSAPGNLSTKTKELFLGYIDELKSGNFDKFINDDFEYDVAEQNKHHAFKQDFMAMVNRHGKDVAIKQLTSLIRHQGKFAHFSEIACPTLLIRGALDKSINIPGQEKILAEIPNAELAIIPNAAHYLTFENPQATAFAIEKWLNKLVISTI